MIESHDIPGIGRAMTGIALVSGLNMGGVLAGGGCPIVTARTETRSLHT